MAGEAFPPSSFSAGRRWTILFSVVVSTLAVFALVIMANYLGARHSLRMNWSAKTALTLSPQTVSLLKSMTNEVKIVVYYDRKDNLYESVAALLDEYRLNCPRISIQTVDYMRETATAQQIKAQYKLSSAEDKNLLIFDCNNGRQGNISGSYLAEYSYEGVPNETEREFHRKLKSFNGEQIIDAFLLNVTDPHPHIAYFLEGDGEHPSESQAQDGYLKFKTILLQMNIQSATLNLLGANPVPANCSLLIIAGPKQVIQPEELEKIRQYLAQGGRLFVLFNETTFNRPTGLEAILADWGVDVGMNLVTDKENTLSGDSGVVVKGFNRSHPLVNPLLDSSLALIFPRSIGKLSPGKQGPEAPKVEELAFTGKNAFSTDNPAKRRIPLMVAVEKMNVKGVFTERGATRIVVTGDSFFLKNDLIGFADNADFAGSAVNWLLDRTQLLQGVGPHPVTDYKVMLTHSQLNSIRWLFLGAMPGGILLLGGLVWLRRRH